MRLHVLGLPWTATTSEYLTCAYTQKLVKFARMMVPRGHEVIMYGTEHNDAPFTEHVQVISENERHGWFGEWGTEALFEKVTWDNTQEPWVVFNNRCTVELLQRVQPGDKVLLVGGNCQKPVADAVSVLTQAVPCEPFCGYEGIFTPYVAFESHYWRSHVYGLCGWKNGRWYDDTIPNYFDPAEFATANKGDGEYLLFVGRLVDRKGVHVAVDIARRLGAQIVVAGPGGRASGKGRIIYDEGDLRYKGLTYAGELGVEARNDLMANAAALLCPTLYLEPFGGVAVEAMMCGTPVISTDWGAFTETVEEGVTGYRFRTLREGAESVLKAGQLDNDAIRARAIEKYSLEAIAPRFERWFEQIDGLRHGGWGA